MLKKYEQLDANNKLIWNFWDISHTMRNISEGKGSQQRILILVNEAGEITQSELTQRLGIQPGSASEVIIKLESAGLLRRIPSPQDKRTTVMLLTEEGEREAERFSALREQRHERMFASLSAQEKDALLELLEKLNGDWDRQYRSEGQGRRHRD